MEFDCVKSACSAQGTASAVERGSTEVIRIDALVHMAASRDTLSGGNLFVSWESHQRSRSLSHALDFELVEILNARIGLLSYLAASFRTLRLIRRRRPNVLVVQNPSLVLSLLAVTVGRAYAGVVVVDAHNAGLFPLEGRSRFLTKLAAYVARKATRVIVTNDELAGYVKALGGAAVVIPDPLPQWSMPVASHGVQAAKVAVTVVCSWASDEPIEAIRQACVQLADTVADVSIAVSGRARRDLVRGSWPANVRLTGYLSEDEYRALLQSSDVVVVLTTRENCLTCGAYEALALEKPMVLSGTAVIRTYFSSGAIYSTARPEDISRAILQAIADRERLTTEARDLRREKELLTQVVIQDLRRELTMLNGASKHSPDTSAV